MSGLSREAFLRSAWESLIEQGDGTWIQSLAQSSAQEPAGAFADAGLAAGRALEAGVAPEDLASFARFVSYEAIHGLLYMLDDPGVRDSSGLYESLLSADPSGREGRPA